MHLSSSEGLPDNYRLFSASNAYYEDEKPEHGKEISDGAHRRLMANSSKKSAVIGELLKTLPFLAELAEKLADDELYQAAGDHPQDLAATPASFMALGPKSLDVAWPPLFEPQHVLCGHQAGYPGKVVALTRRGFASMVSVRHDAARFERAEAEGFALGGVSEHGPLAGATWSRTGLHLVTAAGKLLEC